MMILEHLLPAEKRDLQRAEAVVSKRMDTAVRLRDRLRDWEIFIEECEKGYELSIYDYTNDLSKRTTAEEIVELLPHTTAKKIEPLLVKLDKRFLDATRTVSRPLMKTATPPTRLESMLYFRIPRKLEPEMKSDLHAMGILES